MKRIGVLVFLAATAMLLATVPAGAQGTDDAATEDIEALVVFTGRADVAADEDLETVVIFDGPATVAGTVQEAVVAFNGDVRVSGTVESDVVSFNGRVTVAEGGRVGGDVISRQRAVVAQGAVVDGDVRRFDPNVFDAWFGVVARLAWWLAVSVSVLVLGLVILWLAPRVVDATVAVSRTGIGPAILWGLVALVGGPLVAVILMVTLIGIPLGLFLLGALGVLSVLGYTAAAWILGRRFVREPGSRVGAFLAGLGVLRVIALVPILGGLVWFVAAVFGTGALLVAARRAQAGSLPAPVAPAQV